MRQNEPPSCSSRIFYIGKNNRGNWVAKTEDGLCGGLFISRAEAVRYALFENGRHPEAILTARSTIDLDIARPRSLEDALLTGDKWPQQKAA